MYDLVYHKRKNNESEDICADTGLPKGFNRERDSHTYALFFYEISGTCTKRR